MFHTVDVSRERKDSSTTSWARRLRQASIIFLDQKHRHRHLLNSALLSLYFTQRTTTVHTNIMNFLRNAEVLQKYHIFGADGPALWERLIDMKGEWMLSIPPQTRPCVKAEYILFCARLARRSSAPDVRQRARAR